MKLTALVFILAACVRHVDVDQAIYEATTCAELTAHANGEEAPDCTRMIAAFERGRRRVMTVYAEAHTVKMGSMFFFKPKTFRFPEKDWPLINIGTVAEPFYVGAVTSAEGPALIQYAYEEAIEHEATHAIVRLLDPTRLRTPEAMAADPANDGRGDVRYFFQITCHGTIDDPFGIPGKNTSCDRMRN